MHITYKFWFFLRFLYITCFFGLVDIFFWLTLLLIFIVQLKLLSWSLTFIQRIAPSSAIKSSLCRSRLNTLTSCKWRWHDHKIVLIVIITLIIGINPSQNLVLIFKINKKLFINIINLFLCIYNITVIKVILFIF